VSGLSDRCTRWDDCADPVDEVIAFRYVVIGQNKYSGGSRIVSSLDPTRQSRHRWRFATVAILRREAQSIVRACANARRRVARILAMKRMPKPTPDLSPLATVSEVSAIAADDARKYRRYTPMCPACRQSGRRHQRGPASAQHYICVRCSMRWTAMAQIVDGSFRR